MSVEAAQVGAAYARIRAEIGPEVRVLAATKYLPADALDALALAGLELLGENRLQDLVAKQALPGADRFRWHFIGTLQSRKAAELSRRGVLVHSLDSLSAAARLTVPALVQVNLGREETKSGVAAAKLAEFLAAARELAVEVRGLSTMPPLAQAPEQSRPIFRELRLLAGEHGLGELSMGTSQDYRVAVEEGATIIRLGAALLGR